MTRFEQYKNQFRKDGAEYKILEDYEKDIKELFEQLKKDSKLKINFTTEDVDRIEKFIKTITAPLTLVNDFYKVIDLDNKKRETNFIKLKEGGLRPEKFGEQAESLICYSNHVMIEKLRLHMLLFINFKGLGVHNPEIAGFGILIRKLKEKYNKNKFIEYFNSFTRNAIAHFTYFFEGNRLNLYDNIFDKDPEVIDLSKFMMETKNVNILGEAFFLIFSDLFAPDPLNKPISFEK